MIPTIGDLLFRVHHEKVQMLTQAEKRRAFRLVCAITFCVTIAVLLWILR
jgi:hypothetical protein